MFSTPQSLGIPYDEWRPGQWESVEWARSLWADMAEDSDLSEIVAITEQPTGCHEKGYRVMMYDGTLKAVEDVIVGDRLMGPDSAPRTVLQLCHGNAQMYRVAPVKGDPFIVNGDHVLSLVRTNSSSSGRYRCQRKDCKDGEIISVTVSDWLSLSATQKHLNKLYRVAVEYPVQAELPLDPYFIGVLLGDGTLDHRISVTTADQEIVDEVYKQAAVHGLQVTIEQKSDNIAMSYNLVNKSRKPSRLGRLLSTLGMKGVNSASKYIPQQYLSASRHDRLELLAGLLDTDGYLSRSTNYDWISKSQELAGGIAYLARSLGLAAYVKSCNKYDQQGRGGTYYRVLISGSTEIVPCRLARKKVSTPRRSKKQWLRTGIDTIEPTNIDNYYGFILDNDHLYLGYDCTVFHNSGKSGFAMALGQPELNEKVLALTHTRNLQAQYGSLFPTCHVHFGRSNYSCVHPKRLYSEASAQDCIFGSKMVSCPHYLVCPYVDSKFRARKKQKATVNYAYWNAASSWFSPYYLVLDEAHELPDIVLERSGITFWQFMVNRYDLEPFPSFGTRDWDVINGTTSAAPEKSALKWLRDTAHTLDSLSEGLRENITDRDSAAESAACEHLLNKVNDTIAALESSINDANVQHWYIRTDMEYYRGKYQRRLVCKPLTARFDFSRFFLGNWRTVIMSATIGNAEAFAYELGIEKQYAYRVVPNRWAPETRPVHILDVPSMGRSATTKNPSLFDLQAERIATAIQEQPHDWPGLILVTRKSEAKYLGERLMKLGLSDRIFIMPGADGSYTPTEQQVQLWEHRKKIKPNSICISWSMFTGYDGLDEKILIIAKTPWAYLGDPFENERMKANGKMFHQRAAWTLEQGLGRTRRGRPQDYDLDGEKAGYVAIADGSWNKVQKYLSESTREAIVK